MEKDIEIRKISEADAKAVQHLSDELGYKISLEKTEENIRRINADDNHVALVAVINNKVVGWIHLQKTLFLESPSFIEIVGIVVDEDHRRQGIGKQLVKYGIKWAKKESALKLRVRSNIRRSESHDFYKSIGFAEIKQQKVYDLDLN